ncbi:MAG: hypothetical protein V3V08_04205 [Nannocystaceae bacterium]
MRDSARLIYTAYLLTCCIIPKVALAGGAGGDFRESRRRIHADEPKEAPPDAMANPPAASPTERPLLAGTTALRRTPGAPTPGFDPRLQLGVSAGLAMGFHARGSLVAERWNHGEVTFGLLFGTHFYPLGDLRVTQDGVRVRGTDSIHRLLSSFGHAFALWHHRLLIETYLFSGPSLRRQRTRLTDAAHGVSGDHRYRATYWEAGLAISVGARIGRHFGANLDAVMPLYVSHAEGLHDAMSLSSPFAGISCAYYFEPRRR